MEWVQGYWGWLTTRNAGEVVEHVSAILGMMATVAALWSSWRARSAAEQARAAAEEVRIRLQELRAVSSLSDAIARLTELERHIFRNEPEEIAERANLARRVLIEVRGGLPPERLLIARKYT